MISSNPSLFNIRIAYGNISSFIFGIKSLPVIDINAQYVTTACIDISSYYYKDKYPNGPDTTLAETDTTLAETWEDFEDF